MSDHPRDLGQDPLAPTGDFRNGADSLKVTLPQSLDKLPTIERKYGVDAGIETTQQDIEHLCKVWAEVGRAIISRRQQANEQEDLK